ncbi:MAG: DUF4172 domain-containing protein [Gammaproteobacteria bacterium]|nr:DUF4172 domain-containing protein [Gammaproteobacteria bacterium]
MDLWEQPDWPAFFWDEKTVAGLLAHVAREQGRLLGKMERVDFDLRSEAPDSGKVAYSADESLYQIKATPSQESVKWTN